MNALKSTLSSPLIRSLLSVFLDPRCPVCDRTASNTFCIDCQRQIESTCHKMQGWQPSVENNLFVGTLGDYQGTLKQAILALKYKNCPAVARSLGTALAHRWMVQTKVSIANLYAVPIPLHPNRLSQRGYNQAALISEAFCQVSGLPMLTHGISRTQDTLPQHQLGPDERKANLQSAFVVGQALQKLRRQAKSPPRILLIDDIYTTGATAQSAAQLLREAGIDVVGMLTLARAVND